MSGILILWIVLVVLFSNFSILKLLYHIEIFIVDYQYKSYIYHCHHFWLVEFSWNLINCNYWFLTIFTVSCLYKFIALIIEISFKESNDKFYFWVYVIMSCTRFRVNVHSIVVWMSRNSLLETGAIAEILVTATGFEPTTT